MPQPRSSYPSCFVSQSLKIAAFVSILAVVLGGLNVLVHRRASAAFRLSKRQRYALGWGMGVCLMGTLVGRSLPSPGMARVVAGGGSVVEVALLVQGILFLGERLVVAVARLLMRRSVPAAAVPAAAVPAEPAPLAVSRREWLSRASATAVIAFGGGSAAYGALYGRHDYALEEVPIRLARLPRRLDGFTIVQLSDLHLGLFVGEWELDRAVELVKRARPNLIALTGDLLDHDLAYADDLARFTRRLTGLAPVVAVPGNHDHYAGVDGVLGAVRSGGGTVLLNTHVRVAESQLVVAGVDDLWGRRVGRGPDLARALTGTDDDAPRILLAHQPVFFEGSAPHVALQLSGHTHGGQFNPGLRPADQVLPNGWVAGRYELGQAQLYVNRGFGTAGPPVRLGSTPEVTRIVLTV